MGRITTVAIATIDIDTGVSLVWPMRGRQEVAWDRLNDAMLRVSQQAVVIAVTTAPLPKPSNRSDSSGRADFSGDSLASVSTRVSRRSADSQRRPIGVATERQSANQPDEMEARREAARLLSETAHDLRSPLTTIRESVRMVVDGDLGAISTDQKNCLETAISQCECIEQMVADLMQLERLQFGIPRVQRRSVSVATIRHEVEQTLRPWSIPQGMDILWDADVSTSQSVFADPALIHRLLINLVSNAIKVCKPGNPILIRLNTRRGGNVIRWSVVDGGPGITAANLERIASRQVSMTGGEGLGLSICRQLAALHFSSLEMVSNVGFGTEVSFETPVAGPRSVAESWSRWRLAHANPAMTLRRTRPADHDDLFGSEGGTSDEVARMDGPEYGYKPSRSSQKSNSGHLELHHDGPGPRSVDRLIAGTVTLGAASPVATADAFDRLFQNRMRMFDLVYRVDDRRWVWIFDTEIDQMRDRLQSLNDEASQDIDGVRLSWSDPQLIPVDRRRMLARVSDLLVRETLISQTDHHHTDRNQVRLGTKPIEHSAVATARLDQELQRLGFRMKRQTTAINRHARKMRP